MFGMLIVVCCVMAWKVCPLSGSTSNQHTYKQEAIYLANLKQSSSVLAIYLVK